MLSYTLYDDNIALTFGILSARNSNKLLDIPNLLGLREQFCLVLEFKLSCQYLRSPFWRRARGIVYQGNLHPIVPWPLSVTCLSGFQSGNMQHHPLTAFAQPRLATSFGIEEI